MSIAYVIIFAIFGVLSIKFKNVGSYWFILITALSANFRPLSCLGLCCLNAILMDRHKGETCTLLLGSNFPNCTQHPTHLSYYDLLRVLPPFCIWISWVPMESSFCSSFQDSLFSSSHSSSQWPYVLIFPHICQGSGGGGGRRTQRLFLHCVQPFKNDRLCSTTCKNSGLLKWGEGKMNNIIISRNLL